MTCYSPKLRVEMIGKWEKAADGHLYHPAQIIPCDNQQELLENVKKFNANYKKTVIPCRKCIGCRIDYSRDWANRGYLESKKSPNSNYFVTLTYDDEHLPKKDEITTSKGITYKNDGTWNGCLEPKHLKKFIHDIRQHYYRKNGYKGIKYLACGEYGTENGRPHYHVILFNCPLDADDFYAPRLIDGEYYHQNKLIEKYWKRGISNVGTATWNTIAYVARYVTKKLYGDNAEDSRAQKGQIAEFIRVSNGIGRDYWEENKEKILQTDSITIRNAKGIHQTKPPRYFTRLLKAQNPEVYEELKAKRERDNEMMQKAKDTQHSYGRFDELQNQRRSKEIQAGTLKRTL